MFLCIISWLYSAVKQNVFFLKSVHKHRPDITGCGICVQKCSIPTYNSIFNSYCRLTLGAKVQDALAAELQWWTRADWLPAARLWLPWLGLLSLGRCLVTIEQRLSTHRSSSCSHGHKLPYSFTWPYSKWTCPTAWRATGGYQVCLSLGGIHIPNTAHQLQPGCHRRQSPLPFKCPSSGAFQLNSPV